jgi:hypothetical protein
VPAPLDTRQKLTLRIVEMSKIPDLTHFRQSCLNCKLKCQNLVVLKQFAVVRSTNCQKLVYSLADLKRNGELDRWIVLAKKTTTMLSR